MSDYARSIYRTAARRGWAVEREGDVLVVRDQAGRWVRHLLGGQAEAVRAARLVVEQTGISGDMLGEHDGAPAEADHDVDACRAWEAEMLGAEDDEEAGA